MKVARIVVRFLKQPAGFRIEWLGGGIVFNPPLWSWIILVILFDVCFAGTMVFAR